MNKEDLALNNLQWLIEHKTKSNQTKLNFGQFEFNKFYFAEQFLSI